MESFIKRGLDLREYIKKENFDNLQDNGWSDPAHNADEYKLTVKSSVHRIAISMQLKNVDLRHGKQRKHTGMIGGVC